MKSCFVNVTLNLGTPNNIVQDKYRNLKNRFIQEGLHPFKTSRY